MRDSDIFKASVNVEAEMKVTFNLTYEQLLTRRLETYEHVINVQPGQVSAKYNNIVYFLKDRFEVFVKVIFITKCYNLSI